MKRLLAATAVLMALLWPAVSRAQSGEVVANYAAGWNMVGGPPGTDFSTASSMYAYVGGAYVPPGGASIACPGYWAYFNVPTTVVLPGSATGPTQTCSLQFGWNMVGNPFAGVAQLPADVTAYHWNPDANRYDIVSAIPPGASVWIYSAQANQLVLSYVPTATVPAANLVISGFANLGPYTLHVGDTVELELPSVLNYAASANPTFLTLESSGVTSELSCIGEPACVASPLNSFWIWRAVAPGSAAIQAGPACLQVIPPCAGTLTRIQIDIVP